VVDRTAERVAHNNATFRRANESIAEMAGTLLEGEPVPFICECPTEDCTELLRLPMAEYEAIRRDSTLFVNAPGHHAAAGKHSTLVERRDGYDVVRKVGEAAEIVAEEDS